MSDYKREIVYLKKVDHGMVLSDRGFARLEKKEGELLLHLSVRGIDVEKDSPVYLIYEKEGQMFPHVMGTLEQTENCDFCCDMEYLPPTVDFNRICGVLVGERSCYLSGGCRKTGEYILYEKVVFLQPDKEEKKEKKKEKENFFRRLEPMYPFEDDEMEWCFHIKPEDFSEFPMEFWHYGKNSFLLNGFYNYRHLLYAHKDGKDFIGVPGQFHRREQYLAGRFGFSRFKGIKRKRLSIGDFGYWLREM
jgi:hypothetical protein